MKNSKLLIYEDSEKMDIIQRYLIGLGHPVQSAASVKDAFGLMRTERFDVILTDQLFARNSMNRIYREIKRLHPSMLIIWLDIDKTLSAVPNKFSTTSHDYFHRIVKILDAGSDTSNVYGNKYSNMKYS